MKRREDRLILTRNVTPDFAVTDELLSVIGARNVSR